MRSVHRTERIFTSGLAELTKAGAQKAVFRAVFELTFQREG